MTQLARAYMDVPPAVWAVASDAILAHPATDYYPSEERCIRLRDGSVVVGVRGRALTALPSELLARVGRSFRSLERMHLRLRGESLFDNNTIAELVTLAAEHDPPVNITGWSVQLDIVRAFLGVEFPALTSPRMSAANARQWAESQTLGTLQAWALAHGFWIGHITDQASAVEAVLSEELYQP